MNASRASNVERRLNLRFVAANGGIALLIALLVQLFLKFGLGFSWIWSIVTAIGVVALMGGLVALLVAKSTRHLTEDATWLFGNLPPLDLRSHAATGRTAARFSGHHARPLPPDWRAALSVHINNQAFTLGGRFETDKIFLAGFEKAGSVARVRARALPDQTVLVSRQCVAKSFGGEFIMAPLAKGDPSSPARLDATAFLFFAAPNPARPFPPPGIERITMVAAGGKLALEAVTGSFVDLATEMFGAPHRGSRGQRIWRAEELSLICEEQEYKGLHRSTFTWTAEELDVGGAG